MTDPLHTFFDHRTIGYSNGRWTWRGSGYDEGWDDVTEADLARLRELLTEPPTNGQLLDAINLVLLEVRVLTEIVQDAS